MSDFNLLRCLLSAKQFKSTRSAIPDELCDSNTITMLKWYALYFKRYPEHTCIDTEVLSTLVKLEGKHTAESWALMNQIINRLAEPLSDEIRANTLNQLEERKLSQSVALLCKQYEDGMEVDLTFELGRMYQEATTRRKVLHEGQWCDRDVWELIQADADDAGYVLDFLPKQIYEQLKGVNEGNNLCIAAPTDKGKTSMLVNIAVSLAKQRKVKLAADPALEFRPVLYLVNEGQAEVITPRVYQTALGITREEMWKRGKAGTITAQYEKIVGRKDAIRLVNIHGKSISQVSRIIEAHNPFLVISDMTGRIRIGNSANDIAQLEEVWNTFRELAALMNFIHVGTAQISAEGFDLLYPPVSALQNSKTGIQTTLDLALWIGAFASPTPDNVLMRGISTPKNKLARSGAKSSNEVATFFQPEINRWDIEK